jgi:hypothetical protein
MQFRLMLIRHRVPAAKLLHVIEDQGHSVHASYLRKNFLSYHFRPGIDHVSNIISKM